MNDEFKLLPFQEAGVIELMRGKQILGDDVGLGKTIQAISFCEKMNYKRIIVLCPAPLKENWRDELMKFYNENAIVLEGDPKTRRQIFLGFQADTKYRYLLVNYEQLISKTNDFLFSFDFDCLVADEAHRIKNYKSKTYKNARKIRTKWRIALTATPITNHPLEAYAISNFVRPMFFNLHEFCKKYGIYGMKFLGKKRGHVYMIVDWKNLDELRIALDKLLLKRRKEDVLPDLPQRMYKTYHFDLQSYERKMHDFYFDKMKEAYEQETDDVFSYLALLQQVTNGTRLLSMSESHNVGYLEKDENSKLMLLKEVLEDLGDERCIVFTKFERMARVICSEIGDSCYMISGDTKNKIAAIKEFKESSKKYLVATDCLNYGVNLEFLKTLIHFDLAWTPSRMEQREGRVDRLTQTQKMLIINLIARHTFEEKVIKVLEKKQKYINEAVTGVTDRVLIQEVMYGERDYQTKIA